MKAVTFYLFLGVLLLCTFLGSPVQGLQCHSCNYLEGDESTDACLDPDDEAILKVCPQSTNLLGQTVTVPFCSKIIATYNGKQEIKRDCISLSDALFDEGCIKLEEYNKKLGSLFKSNNADGEICLCDDEDGCNGASGLQTSLVGFLLVGFAVIFGIRY